MTPLWRIEGVFLKVAIIGSRTLQVNDLGEYLPIGISEIVSGGAKGIDTQAREYAKKNNLPLKEFLPEYHKYGRSAPLKRNLQIVAYADTVVAFWDGVSKGTKYVIDIYQKQGKKITVHFLWTVIFYGISVATAVASPPIAQLSPTYFTNSLGEHIL